MIRVVLFTVPAVQGNATALSALQNGTLKKQEMKLRVHAHFVVAIVIAKLACGRFCL